MNMTFVFVSNYFNHHQKPFCDAMYAALGAGFTFLETEEMTEERKAMGWGEALPGYVKRLDAAEPSYVNLITEADMVLFGDAPEHLITPRLLANRPTLRVSESIYKEGQWKFITPRGLWRKYLDHIRFRRNRVWLLCAGGYVASDFSLIHAYPGKMLKWGYFPETRRYDMVALMGGKPLHTAASQPTAAPQPTAPLPRILWVGRMIDWKHPEWALEIARSLTKEGIPYDMELIGEGPLLEALKSSAEAGRLSVRFTPFLSPGDVRKRMEQADIFLLLSDKREGWGAVLNEAMNSGCAVIANARAGAVPFLLDPAARETENSTPPGFVFRNGDIASAAAYAKRLIMDPALARRTGFAAYRRITGLWNAELAAKRLLAVSEAILSDGPLPQYEEGPCSVAENVSVGRFCRGIRN